MEEQDPPSSMCYGDDVNDEEGAAKREMSNYSESASADGSSYTSYNSASEVEENKTEQGGWIRSAGVQDNGEVKSRRSSRIFASLKRVHEYRSHQEIDPRRRRSDATVHDHLTAPSETNNLQSDLLKGDLCSKGGKDWNQEYQILVHSKDSPQKYKALYYLAHDFVYAAKTYGKIIISEMKLTNEEKTIKAIDVGGIAGGAKYICHSIFFKFATDQKVGEDLFMYGGSEPDDDAARKAAGLELQGLSAYYNIHITSLHFPLFALIDYRGYRLCAMSILPIGKDTLVYGSSDGGRTVLAEDPKFNDIMEDAGNLMNLKAHTVGGKLLFGPGDIEGHKGRDGKYYLLDFSRTFPPEAPDVPNNVIPRTVYYQHLRPEFVRQYSKPLSPDVFTRWGHVDRAVHNAEVREATDYLLAVVIPGLAKKLDDLATSEETGSIIRLRLAEEMHRHGVNVRHAGLVRQWSTNPLIRSILLVEMVARVQKADLNKRMRDKMQVERLPVRIPYLDATVNFLNLILGGDISKDGIQATNYYWHTTVKEQLTKCFIQSLEEAEWAPTFDLRIVLNVSYLLQRLQECVGVQLNERILLEARKAWSPDIVLGIGTFDSVRVLESDIKKIGAKVKHLNLIDEAEAMALFLEAKTCSGTQADQLWEVMDKKFRAAMAGSTNNAATLFQWGNALFCRAKRLPPREAEIYYHDCSDKYEQCFHLHPRHYESMFQQGRVFIRIASLYPLDSPEQQIYLGQAEAIHIRALSGKTSLRKKLEHLARSKLKKGIDRAFTYFKRELMTSRLNDFVENENESHDDTSRDEAQRLLVESTAYYTMLLRAGEFNENLVIKDNVKVVNILYNLARGIFELVAMNIPCTNNIVSMVSSYIDGFFARSSPCLISDGIYVYSINHLNKTTAAIEVYKSISSGSVGPQYALCKTLNKQISGSSKISFRPIVDFLSQSSMAGYLKIAHSLLNPETNAEIPGKKGAVIFQYYVDSFILQGIKIDLMPMEDEIYVSPAKIDAFVLTKRPPNDVLKDIVIGGMPIGEEFNKFCKLYGLIPVASIDTVHKDRNSRHFNFQISDSIVGRYVLISFAPPVGKVRSMWIKNISIQGRHHVKDLGVNVQNPHFSSHRMANALAIQDSDLDKTLKEYDIFRPIHLLQGKYLAAALRVAQFSPSFAVLLQSHIQFCTVPIFPSDSNLREKTKNKQGKRKAIKKMIGGRTAIKGSRIVPVHSESFSGNGYTMIQLSNCGNINEKSLEQLVDTALSINGLDADGCSMIGDECLLRFVQNQPHLELLRLQNCKLISDGVFRQIIERCACSLEELALPPQATFVWLNQSFVNLHVLSVVDSHTFNDKSLGIVAKYCTEIEQLEIAGCKEVTDKGIQAIFKSNIQYTLKTLAIDRCKNVTNKSLSYLSLCPLLTRVSISRKQYGSEGIDDEPFVPLFLQRKMELVAVAGCTGITNTCINVLALSADTLSTLDLSFLSKITDNSLVYLATACRALKNLLLRHTECSDFALCLFVTNNPLQLLLIDGCAKLSDESLICCSENTTLSILCARSLPLITYRGVHSIITNSKSLSLLDVSGCKQLSQSFLRKLNKSGNRSLILRANFGMRPTLGESELRN